MATFREQVVVVTGAGSGIGRATAQMFGKERAKVVLLDINAESGNKVLESIRRNDGEAIFIQTDISDKKAVEIAAGRVARRFGRVDILVNNAGIEFNEVGNMVSMPYDKLERIIQVNQYGAINCDRSFIQIMEKGVKEGKQDGGAVVHVSSIQGIGALTPGTSYQATKAALLGLTNALAVEEGKYNIRVNTVLPGAIATEGMGSVEGRDTPILAAFRKRIPLGRRGFAEEVASAILFLCSESASYITGAELLVDGGYTKNLTPDSIIDDQPVRKNDPDA